VDGSSFGNPGRGGFSGLIRNDIGEWMHGFSGSCGRALLTFWQSFVIF
jgi:hypothetical protein